MNTKQQKAESVQFWKEEEQPALRNTPFYMVLFTTWYNNMFQHYRRRGPPVKL